MLWRFRACGTGLALEDHEALAGQKSLSHGGDGETQPQERAALEARSGEIMNPE